MKSSLAMGISLALVIKHIFMIYLKMVLWY